MAKDLDQVHYYYDSHPTEEDLMGETSWHASLIRYLYAMLSWLFRGQVCAIYDDLSFYQTLNYGEYPVAPDIAVIKGVSYRHTRNWVLSNGDPSPHVVFEILSEETWKKDVREKPSTYANMGVLEYFTYDPHEPPLRRGNLPRLQGWRLNTQSKAMVPLIANHEGWLWSEQLESWLVPDGIYLRLYDRDHQMRLTEAEAQAQQADIEAERAEAALRKAQALAEQLRALGINPDEI